MTDEETPRTETDGSGEAAEASEAAEAEAESGTDEAAAAAATEATDETPAGPTGREQLESAIEENPEAVATFVRRLDAVNELLDVLALGEEAMTDEMVVELADTGSTLAESADGLATEETVRLAESIGANGDELADALETLVDLQRRGTLQELAEVAEVVSLASDALTDEMVVSLAGTGASLGELADTAAEPDTRDGLARLLSAVGTAERTERASPSTLSLVKSLRDDDVKQGMAYVIALAKAIGAGAGDPTGED
ncbi:DUF1641 domain-containing protein [Haloglomus litoreum]|uniref:DUF1641 domain-containing protein n=1 Tax=Haloglomus litoreum TaxID=3034026 RepID=UPI0023E8C6DC|nr:DUF1641 domain-containing protein [Haloglomus sp. DT116]